MSSIQEKSALLAIQSSWSSLDDNSIIRDVLFKGKFIGNALKFISERNSISIDKTKLIFFDIVRNIVKTLIQNKQLHRASHVLKNAQINEIHYLYDLVQEFSDESIKMIVMEFIRRSSGTEGEEFIDYEKLLKAHHTCFMLLLKNIQKHGKYLENLNRVHNNNLIRVDNIDDSNIIFSTYMKQPNKWKNEIAVDVFFKSKCDPNIIDVLPILDKESFYNYILQNELYGLLKKWLNEQYLCRAGGAILSTIPQPETFDDALNFLFRKWNFEPFMMEKISRREKDTIKNDFAKLGLFESHEAKCVRRKLNRLFTTHTFQENFNVAVKKDEITKFIIDNKIVSLLCESFIDHDYIQELLRTGYDTMIKDELILVENLKDLLTEKTTIEEFVKIMNVTTEYLKKRDKSFDDKRFDLILLNSTYTGSMEDLPKLAEHSKFLNDLNIKLNSEEELPTLEDLLLYYHSIDVNLIREEFENKEEISIDDPQMSKLYGVKVELDFLFYVKEYQGVYATHVFLRDMLKNSLTISKPLILRGCVEVAKLALDDPHDENLTVHACAFLESFRINTRNLRCLLRLLRMKPTPDMKGFGKYLNETIKATPEDDDLMNVEALEVFWRVKKYQNPPRGYLTPFLESDDWLRFVFFAQYFNYPLKEFVSICQTRIKNETLRDNLIRAVSYEIPDVKRICSYKRPRKSKSSEVLDSVELFKGGKFLDNKHDLFAIILKCNETVSRVELPFEEFQKYFLKKSKKVEHVDDLLFYAKKYDWPLIAVLAATTSLYRIKYCWITYLMLSSDYILTKKFEKLEDLTESVFEHCILIGFIRTLNQSVEIFYPDSVMRIFTKFLLETKKGNFKDMDIQLKLFIAKLNENDFKTIVFKEKEKLLPFIFRCIIIHLQHNIRYCVQKEKYLECLHVSEISQFNRKIDFGFLKKLTKILEHTTTTITYEVFYDCEKKISKEIDRICDELIQCDEFNAAMEVAELMRLPKTEFVFRFWRHMYDKEEQKQTSFDINKYMVYVKTYEIDIEIFNKFLNTVVDEMVECLEKYNIMKFILQNSKKDNDELEYDIIYLYIRLKCLGETPKIEPLTSSHYNQSIKGGKFLIHNSLYELKSLARIDELSISYRNLESETEINQLEQLICHLLDIQDIVQVMRVQEMFGHAPEDLKILVYMLSICEGITTIYDISKEERQQISNYGQLSNKFNRFTLKYLRTSSANSMTSSMASMDINESSILNESHRYHENKETFEALQGLASKIKHGHKYAHRVVLIYRISLYLNLPFKDLLRISNSFEFLGLAASSDCDTKLLVMSDIFEAMDMTNMEIAEFIAKEIASCIVKTRFLEFNKETEMVGSTTSSWSPSHQVLDDIWGFSLSKDLNLILELAKGRATLLGKFILKFYKIISQPAVDIPLQSSDKELQKICEHLNKVLTPQLMSQKKQNVIQVEMLITAHECFCQETSTEGISTILNLAKHLVKTLTEKKNFHLIVKLLCGIGRYREMYYCFEIIIKNEVFEVLLGQFSENQEKGLKKALLAYLNENHPNNREYHRMVATHFNMYNELAKISKKSAMEKIQKVINDFQVKKMREGKIFTNQLQQVEIPYLKCNKNVITILHEAVDDMIHAMEMHTADNKIEITLKTTSHCELIAMQIHLVKVGEGSGEKLCPCVINQEQNDEKFQYLANYELLVPQAMILDDNIESSIDFSKAIFCRAVMSGDSAYLQDFVDRNDITDPMIETIVKLAQCEVITLKEEKVLQEIVTMVRDVGLKFKLASLLGLKALLQQMVNDEDIYYYLVDSKYGTVDIYN